MLYSGIPAKFPIPWANSAGTSFIRAIPQASQIGIQNGAASLTDGFPPNCFVPIAGGGSWPFAQDFNGVLKQITQWEQWVQAGGPITYDSTFQTAISGYPKGAMIASATTAGQYWRSTVDNNTTNPDTGGAGWVSAFAGRVLNVQIFSSSGTYTPTPGTNSVLVMVVGAGGAGGGAAATTASQYSVGSGGASGSVGMSRLTSGFAGVNVTVGAGGAGISALTGNPGGASSFGSLISAPGGGGGQATILANTTTGLSAQGGPGASATGGNLVVASGQAGPCGLILAQGPVSGQGAPGPWLGGAGNTSNSAGGGGHGPGAGGGGAGAATSSGPFAGGAGAAGYVIVWEYS